MQRHFRLWGGVAPKTTRLRGQSIIEYVLIAAVIGLVVVFAGSQVSGAIRNQFNQVTNTVDSGTGGDNFMSAEEKAYGEAMKTVAQKEAKDWTLDEQKAAADDIAKNGTSSVVYAKAEAAMDARSSWSVKLTNERTMRHRIIGINHDDLTDGSGKAGLTFQVTNDCFGSSREDYGPWSGSNMRKSLNSGSYWGLLPEDMQSKIATVSKLTNNQRGDLAEAEISNTEDRLFLLSRAETYQNTKKYDREEKEGTLYEAKPMSSYLRSLSTVSGYQNRLSDASGQPIIYANSGRTVCPAFCF